MKAYELRKQADIVNSDSHKIAEIKHTLLIYMHQCAQSGLYKFHTHSHGLNTYFTLNNQFRTALKQLESAGYTVVLEEETENSDANLTISWENA